MLMQKYLKLILNKNDNIHKAKLNKNKLYIKQTIKHEQVKNISTFNTYYHLEVLTKSN